MMCSGFANHGWLLVVVCLQNRTDPTALPASQSVSELLQSNLSLQHKLTNTQADLAVAVDTVHTTKALFNELKQTAMQQIEEQRKLVEAQKQSHAQLMSEHHQKTAKLMESQARQSDDLKAQAKSMRADLNKLVKEQRDTDNELRTTKAKLVRAVVMRALRRLSHSVTIVRV